MVRPSGIEPPHTAPEAVALSTELRACLPNECYYSRVSQKMQGLFYFFFRFREIHLESVHGKGPVDTLDHGFRGIESAVSRPDAAPSIDHRALGRSGRLGLETGAGRRSCFQVGIQTCPGGSCTGIEHTGVLLPGTSVHDIELAADSADPFHVGSKILQRDVQIDFVIPQELISGKEDLPRWIQDHQPPQGVVGMGQGQDIQFPVL